MRKQIAVLLAVALIVSSWTSYAEAAEKTKTRYTTQTVKLGTQKVPYNTKVILIKSSKATSIVEYQGERYKVKTKYLHAKKAVNKYKGRKFKRVGHAKWNGYSWTWYTTRQYPDRKNALGIKGKHKDKRGFICDKDGYICLASGRGNKKKHAIVPTPFGKYGKVYDTNGGYNNRWFDVYTSW